MRVAVAAFIVATQTVAATQQPRPAAPSPVVSSLQTASKNGVAALAGWVEAVRRHHPGARDEAAAAVASISPQALDDLVPYVVTLADLVSARAPDSSAGRNTGRPSSPARDRLAGDARRRLTAAQRGEVLALAKSVATSADADRLLLRAATLHADAVMLMAPELAAAGRDASSSRLSFLRPRSVSWTFDDGDGGQRVAVDGFHWQVARSLLGFASRQPAALDSMRAWYIGTTAWLARSQNLPELDSHVGEATRRLPDDAAILLLGGWLQEMLASSPVQNEIQSRLAPSRTRFTRTMVPLAPACSYNPCAGQLRPFGVGSATEHLSWAETLLERALAGDARSTEAGVRLGRVVAQRSRHEQAIDHLERALAGSIDRTLAFDALLFLGTSMEALGRDSAAADAYRRALALFPAAQSARIALSHLLSKRGARSEAVEILRSPSPDGGGDSWADDPWWTYHFGPGRTSEAALERLWALMSRSPAP
jgi:hypothetical protein